MHIRKTSILIFSLALVGLLALGLATPSLKTSVIQFSMSIATSPEEPIEPEEPEEPEPQDGKGSGGGTGTLVEPEESVEPEKPIEPVPIETEETMEPMEPEELEPSKPEETSGSSSSGSTPEDLPTEESPLKIVQKPAQIIEDMEEFITIPPSEELIQIELEHGTKQIPDLLELNLSAFCEDLAEVREENFLSKIFSQIALWWQILKQLVQQHLF